MKEIKVTNFDARFGQYMEKWMRENRARFANMDEMEAQMPDVYLRWLNLPADWLDGEAPGMYFQRFDTGEALVELLLEYQSRRVPLPDPLLSRIVELGEASVAALSRVAFDASAQTETRMTALGALLEIQSATPLSQLVSLIVRREDAEELINLAAEALVSLGRACVPAVLDAIAHAPANTQLVLFDVLCNFPGDARIYDYGIRLLRELPEQRALLASYFGKLGDARAIAALRPLLTLSELNYLEYIEIRNAIESLGGEVDDARSFDGDPYYESLKRMGSEP